MAQGFAKLVPDFLYVINFTRDTAIFTGVPYIETNPRQWPLRRYRLLSVWLFLWLGWFLATHRKWRDAVVVTQDSKVAHIALFWRIVFPLRVIFECHGLHCPASDPYVCRNADALIFVSDKTMNIAQKEFGSKVPMFLMPVVVDVSEYDSFRHKKTALRQTLRLPADKLLIGYVGRFTALGANKGITTSLNAFARAELHGSELCLIGGTNEEIASARAEAERLGITERVRFIPFVHDRQKVVQYLCAMDIVFYLPPPEHFFVEETSPMKLFEYMAAEKPIIVSDFPTMRAILDDDSAVFVDPTNIGAVADAFQRLAGDPTLRDRLATEAFKKVRGQSWDERAKEMLNIVSEATTNSREPR